MDNICAKNVKLCKKSLLFQDIYPIAVLAESSPEKTSSARQRVEAASFVLAII